MVKRRRQRLLKQQPGMNGSFRGSNSYRYGAGSFAPFHRTRVRPSAGVAIGNGGMCAVRENPGYAAIRQAKSHGDIGNTGPGGIADLNHNPAGQMGPDHRGSSWISNDLQMQFSWFGYPGRRGWDGARRLGR